MTQITAPGQGGQLAVESADVIDRLMRKAAGPEFLQQIKLTYAVSEAFKNKVADVDDWMLGKDLNLGKQFKIVIGPRIRQAMRLKDGSVDLISFNLTPNSKYNAITNDWEYPDGITPDFREILEKKIPDQGQKLVNLIGYLHLFYLPEHQQFGAYYLAKTALTMTNLQEVLKNNKGRTAIFTSDFGKGAGQSKNNSWTLPVIRLLPESESIQFPQTDEAIEILTKFLNPGIVFDPNQKESVRPR